MSARDVEALLFRHEIGRYLLSRFAYQYLRPLWTTRMAPLDAVALQPSLEPPAGWVRLRVRLAGICGSDLSVITGRDSLYLEPEATYPFVPGHEIVADVAPDQDVPANPRGVRAGGRVAVWPVFGCATRGADAPCSACAQGWDGLCERRDGSGWSGSALAIGFCRETGGGWSRECVAHVSQLWPLPEEVGDADALLLDPAATALGSLLRSEDAPARTLIVGGGTIGLLCGVLARDLGLPGSYEVMVNHEAQRRWAETQGLAASIVRESAQFSAWTAKRGMRATRVPGYGDVVRGTFDRVIDAAGTRSSLRRAISAVRPGGELVLASSASALDGIDPTPLWYREIHCRGVNGYGPVRWEGRWVHPYDLLLPRLAEGSVALRDLNTHQFPLREFRRAITTALRKDSGAIKVALAPEPRNPSGRPSS